MLDMKVIQRRSSQRLLARAFRDESGVAELALTVFAPESVAIWRKPANAHERDKKRREYILAVRTGSARRCKVMTMDSH